MMSVSLLPADRSKIVPGLDDETCVWDRKSIDVIYIYIAGTHKGGGSEGTLFLRVLLQREVVTFTLTN